MLVGGYMWQVIQLWLYLAVNREHLEPIRTTSGGSSRGWDSISP